MTYKTDLERLHQEQLLPLCHRIESLKHQYQFNGTMGRGLKSLDDAAKALRDDVLRLSDALVEPLFPQVDDFVTALTQGNLPDESLWYRLTLDPSGVVMMVRIYDRAGDGELLVKAPVTDLLASVLNAYGLLKRDM